MEIAVEPATATVVTDLAALARAARSELEAYRGGALFVSRDSLREPLEEALVALIDEDGALVLAGTVDGTAVGYAVVVAAAGDPVAVIRELVVDPAAREVGLGEALLDAAMAWATAHGCRGIDSFALPGARETKNFFETAGMKARLLVVHREL